MRARLRGAGSGEGVPNVVDLPAAAVDNQGAVFAVEGHARAAEALEREFAALLVRVQERVGGRRDLGDLVVIEPLPELAAGDSIALIAE